MGNLDHSVEELIQNAIKQGAFKDLPGTGKPINLDDASEDSEWRAAHRILKRNGFSLPWIEENKEIDKVLSEARARLRRAWARYGPAREGEPLAAATRWEQEVEAFRKQLTELNRRILTYNLKVPSTVVQRSSLNIDREIRAAQDEGR